MILTSENLFLIILGIVWIIGAIFQDLKRREVDNIWNFSLIAFALAYRASASIYTWDYWFLLNGLIGLGFFIILGNVFYYSRIFAGGDAKLLIALGAVLPLSYDWIINLKIFSIFVIGFMLGGSIYVFIWSLVLVFKNLDKFKKEFSKQNKNNKSIYLISFISGLLIFLIFIFTARELAFISLVFFLFPFLFVYAKSVEESCMVKSVWPKDLTAGDWLYEDVFVNGKKIKKDWEGVSERELKLIQEKYRRKILVKYGVPFTPSFLIGFIAVILLRGFI